jgi:uncharacterized protein (DUF1501 family)
MRASHGESLTRRELLRLSAAGVASVSLSGWLAPLAAHAAREAAGGRRHRSCILLWMDGGPSHIDTFDPKPDAPERIRGSLKAIPTSVPGVRISEKFPRLAQLMQHAAILRGMSTDEADHGRARIYMHTGYKPGIGGVSYPGLGSTVSAELGRDDDSLPNFVVTGTPLNKHTFLTNPGYRGPRHQPMVVGDLSRGVEHLRPAVDEADFADRVGVLEELEAGFARTYRSAHGAGAADAHRATLGRALRLMRSSQARAFDLSLEPAAVRQAYGDNRFGQGCLLARRLVENGVAFVEVYLQNWDTHVKKTADDALVLMSWVDAGMSTLLRDLKERGLLDSTLVVWMGEFGRTPHINNNGGRDHHSRAWSTVLAGGGIRGGQVVGKTDRDGGRVSERPISAGDFLATVCSALGIRSDRQIDTPSGRPITIVDKVARPIKELLG